LQRSLTAEVSSGINFPRAGKALPTANVIPFSDVILARPALSKCANSGTKWFVAPRAVVAKAPQWGLFVRQKFVNG